MKPEAIIAALDLFGIAVFAASGALVAGTAPTMKDLVAKAGPVLEHNDNFRWGVAV